MQKTPFNTKEESRSVMNEEKTWHLATDKDELEITSIELELWRVHYGFIRWQEKCEKYANGIELSCDELAVLHVIRMYERPKTIYDIGLILNRDDIFNIQYNVNKLIKKGFISKQPSPENKKQHQYLPTQQGIDDIDRYTIMRRQSLINEFIKGEKTKNLPQIDELKNLRKIYDGASIAVSLYRPKEE